MSDSKKGELRKTSAPAYWPSQMAQDTPSKNQGTATEEPQVSNGRGFVSFPPTDAYTPQVDNATGIHERSMSQSAAIDPVEASKQETARRNWFFSRRFGIPETLLNRLSPTLMEGGMSPQTRGSPSPH